MIININLSKLCYYDQRNPDFQIKEEFGYEKEEIELTGNFAKKDCSCDNCFYGRSELVEQLIKHKFLSDKLFDLEDMKKCFNQGQIYSLPEQSVMEERLTFNQFIQFLQQKKLKQLT